MEDCIQIRTARKREVQQLSDLWYEGWVEAHAELLPTTLRPYRTRDAFRHRMEQLLPRVRVAAIGGGPFGFHIVKGAELYQLYVSASRRGTGIAARLMNDAETALRADGVRTAWLACAIGNTRAARFYAKCGWRQAGIMVQETEIEGGTFPLEVWRFELDLMARRLAP